MHALEAPLRRGLDALALQLEEPQVVQLLGYLDLVQKWNKVYNLTAVRDPAEMVSQHLLDCLAVLPSLRARLPEVPGRLLDVGSGAGLPGIVIAICRPDIRVDCVDTVAKKAAFIQQVAVTLQLSNLRGLHARVESLPADYGVITSRAFASLKDFVSWSGGALQEGGVWMAMKGRLPQEEIDQLPPEVRVFHVEQLKVPGLDAERCLIWLRRAAPVT
ncbi:16S rRNA (guanine(527)-N(7))-methyltransferase RsmG [Caenimonas aquaedulcis]|uniref:Ribosomal RNA small subunit methyltransferase G n=1 Tax=Caenimonas aquaedulcis TaxID=2793270 RepID=A0A931MHR4_9BURK|nr:16S rRNA (guanine(527)-N(7))-methyltransferase RsmG [Caenimonas aquaedulcis]MBG9389088.1 16S rRNA (guanine(527)-N(7))-methyltransferase RsmG [Caenimonas aquaedulcis]